MKRITKIVNKLLYRVPIKKSLRVLFLSVFLTPVILLSIIYTVVLHSTMLNWEMTYIQDNLIQTERIFNNTLEQIQNLSDRIYLNKQLRNVLLTEYKDIQEVYEDYSDLKIFESYLQSYLEVSSYRIYTENSTLLDNQFIIKATPDIKNQEWYKTARSEYGHAFWNYQTDYLSKKNYVSLVRSLWNYNDRRFLGVLVINLNPDIIQKNLSSLMFETNICLADKIIYSSKEVMSQENKKILAENLRRYSKRNEINTIKYDNEKFGIFTKDLFPKNLYELKFSIMYLIPMKQIRKTAKTTTISTIIVLILLIFLFILSIIIYGNYIENRVKKVQKGIANVVENNFEISDSIGGNDEFEAIYRNLYEMSGNIKTLIDKIYTQNLEKEQLAARQSEISFKMLSNQINPHFLFNTLETIRMKSLSSGDKEVATMLKLLASLLRYNLTVKGKPVPLIDEINSIQNYLSIQHMRFGNRISYDVVTLCDIQKINILPLLIQPIVENSFSHGLEDKVSGGFIYILVNCEQVENKTLVTIQVKDNGCGIPEDKLEELGKKLENNVPDENNNSIGMMNVNSRIKLFYGPDSGISIESEIGEGTVVTLKIYC